MCGNVPGQNLGDPVNRIFSAAFQHEAQIGLGIQAIELGAADTTVDRSSALACRANSTLIQSYATACRDEFWPDVNVSAEFPPSTNGSQAVWSRRHAPRRPAPKMRTSSRKFPGNLVPVGTHKDCGRDCLMNELRLLAIRLPESGWSCRTATSRVCEFVKSGS